MTVLTPKEIVAELDKYIIGQGKAKRSVAIALRNRWRRQQVDPELRDEIAPKNIIMIGPTGIGKTEIARRIAKLADSPFLKIEATKFTEVGYVGRDVESIVRDLVELAVNMAKREEQTNVEEKAEELAEERLLDLLLPSKRDETEKSEDDRQGRLELAELTDKIEILSPTREKLRTMLREGKLDERFVELEVSSGSGSPMIEILSTSGIEEIEFNIKEVFGNMFQPKKKKRKVKVPEALEILCQEESQKLIDIDKVIDQAIHNTEHNGIVFLDELDKIADSNSYGPDVSREGVQRDLLPIVEGSIVTTKYGMVSTDHILFIAAGAFNVSKPSDLLPELQGRFPIRVELDSLSKEDFIRILTEPKNALISQYEALMATEDIKLTFDENAITEIAGIASRVNEQMENIGARRLHTIMETLVEEISFDAPDMTEKTILITKEYVTEKLKDILEDENLSRYIL